jgi:hypothetical protein
MECVTLDTLTWAHADRHLMPSGFLTACVLVTDGKCPDRYEFPICTIVLCTWGLNQFATSMNNYFVLYAV